MKVAGEALRSDYRSPDMTGHKVHRGTGTGRGKDKVASHSCRSSNQGRRKTESRGPGASRVGLEWGAWHIQNWTGVAARPRFDTARSFD